MAIELKNIISKFNLCLYIKKMDLIQENAHIPTTLQKQSMKKTFGFPKQKQYSLYIFGNNEIKLEIKGEIVFII